MWVANRSASSSHTKSRRQSENSEVIRHTLHKGLCDARQEDVGCEVIRAILTVPRSLLVFRLRDVPGVDWHVSKVPILLQKSVETGRQP
jgi:hypothetical protein